MWLPATGLAGGFCTLCDRGFSAQGDFYAPAFGYGIKKLRRPAPGDRSVRGCVVVGMGMRRELLRAEGFCLCAALLAQTFGTEARPGTWVNRHAAPQIGQGKSRASIAAIGRAQDGKKSLVL